MQASKKLHPQKRFFCTCPGNRLHHRNFRSFLFPVHRSRPLDKLQNRLLVSVPWKVNLDIMTSWKSLVLISPIFNIRLKPDQRTGISHLPGRKETGKNKVNRPRRNRSDRFPAALWVAMNPISKRRASQQFSKKKGPVSPCQLKYLYSQPV